MRLARRGLLGVPALLAAPTLLACPAAAQSWPDRPLRLIVPFPPGGNIDLFGRLLAAQMTPRLGQPVVVENRAGAGGSLGAETVATARPDGYTLLVGSNGSLVGNTLTQANLPYDPFRQLQPIGLCVTLPLVLVVRADHPARTVQEFVAMAKAQPGKVALGNAGTGTSNHLAAVLFDAASGAGVTHVPYRGIAPALTDLLAGTLTGLMDQISIALPLQREGKVRLLASTGERRSRHAPELPTLVESGYDGAVLITWNGLSATAGTPQPILAKLAALLPECLADPALRDRMEALGVEMATPEQATPEAFARFLRADLERTRRAVQLAGLRPE